MLLASCGAAPPGQEASSPASPRRTFDFYVLALSWSPGFCATPAGRNEPEQCGPNRRFAFVLHGLWPQYEKGGWPESCSNEKVSEGIVESMLAIMPSRKLVEHEWEKHGTCSGVGTKEYFDEASSAFTSVRIPARFQQPARRIVVNAEEVRQEFVSANPGVGFVVQCSGNGRYLEEVRACLRTDLKGRACSREVERDACRSKQVIMRPVR
jgi:ribonuclease T2